MMEISNVSLENKSIVCPDIRAAMTNLAFDTNVCVPVRRAHITLI